MADEAERLVTAPFREIVEKGNVALENAQNAEDEKAASMLKAAQSLVKEGDRALKRIEPLCTNNYSEYGTNFIDAVKEHDELAQYRSELEDLLWDFDDYVEVDEFDADKFDQLQKTSRKVAPKVLDILKRMKLVHPPPPAQPLGAVSALGGSTGTASANRVGAQSPATGIVTISPTDGGIPVEAGRTISVMMGAVAGPDEGLAGRPAATVISDLNRSDSHRSGLSEGISEPPPRPPSADPWQLDKVPPTTSGSPSEGEHTERRPLVGKDSPTLHPAIFYGAVGPQSPSRGAARKSVHNSEDERRMREASQSARASSDGSFSPPPRSTRWTSSTFGSNDSAPAALRISQQQNNPLELGRSPPSEISGSDGGYSPSVFEGLIPVETEGSIRDTPMPPRQPDCSIGPNSSFYKLKGFCKGAEEAMRGGIGFKKIKRPVGKQLFLHLARHPRPLPSVAGLTVIEGPDMSPQSKDNFDLFFPSPPVQSIMTGIMPEISRLPTAMATETRKLQHGIMRTPQDRTPVLHFAVGAKIVGIEFPAKYDGKWALGWHDGVRAAFEADAVLLDTPPKGEIRMQGTSSLQAIARWKWNQKGGDEKWLKFDKGDVIKNISWSHKDHWCWSGTSSKGWGIFPQSHIEPKSITTVQLGDSGSVSSGGGVGGGGGEKKSTWLSIRRNTDLSSVESFPRRSGSAGGGIFDEASSSSSRYDLFKQVSSPTKPPVDAQWMNEEDVGRSRAICTGL
ncbi:hypothetical protein DL766_006204 [Monosporascus sp. MC13-8B]|uniref:SH3 domain-containing protein n=1 Tax=Monosporascus cannonballus TaxID=155416 RepID=A0ABY0GZB5_9PEZI|nr:hypothetical protein DL762_008952 [Monosporascus cannonballus]RYO80098.1 hypothetical protein DL763_009033 [Monosporascus cannonballus]RYP27829.1 hypothetical protein DL766_006204 [Monosporascus sp. MC13-8B]